jgi:hypothetical protein
MPLRISSGRRVVSTQIKAFLVLLKLSSGICAAAATS